MRRIDGRIVDFEVGKIGVVCVVNSEAYKKLKGEKGWVARPEWEFKVFKKPAGLKIDHHGDVTILSTRELKELVYGKTDFSRYPQIGRKMYGAVMRKAAEALGVIYRPYMVEAATPERMKRVSFRLPEPKEWEIALKRVDELKKKEERTDRFIDYLERLVKVKKESEKK